MVLTGAVGGWAATRAVAGQSPLTTVTVATERPTRAHTDDLGFTSQVPENWTERRDGPVGQLRQPGRQRGAHRGPRDLARGRC